MRTLQSPTHGMTLVELLVALTVLAFLMMAAMPSLTGWMRNTQIRTAAEAVLNGLNKARSEALRRNTLVSFSLVSTNASDPGKLDASCALSNTSASWVVSRQSPAGLCNVAPSDSTAPMIIEKWAQGDSGKTITVSVTTANADGSCSTTASTATQVTFDGYGRASGTASMRCINLDNSSGSGNRKLRITVGTGGTLRMCDPGVTNTSDPRKC